MRAFVVSHTEFDAVIVDEVVVVDEAAVLDGRAAAEEISDALNAREGLPPSTGAASVTGPHAATRAGAGARTLVVILALALGVLAAPARAQAGADGPCRLKDGTSCEPLLPHPEAQCVQERQALQRDATVKAKRATCVDGRDQVRAERRLEVEVELACDAECAEQASAVASWAISAKACDDSAHGYGSNLRHARAKEAKTCAKPRSEKPASAEQSRLLRDGRAFLGQPCVVHAGPQVPDWGEQQGAGYRNGRWWQDGMQVFRCVPPEEAARLQQAGNPCPAWDWDRGGNAIWWQGTLEQRGSTWTCVRGAAVKPPYAEDGKDCWWRDWDGRTYGPIWSGRWLRTGEGGWVCGDRVGSRWCR